MKYEIKKMNDYIEYLHSCISSILNACYSEGFIKKQDVGIILKRIGSQEEYNEI
jgi:hypothetical protein